MLRFLITGVGVAWASLIVSLVWDDDRLFAIALFIGLLFYLLFALPILRPTGR